jgi:exonuclease SbcC
VDVGYQDAFIADLIAQQNLNKNELADINKSIKSETTLVKQLEKDRNDYEQYLLFLESFQFTLLSDDLKSLFGGAIIDVQTLLADKQRISIEIETIQKAIESQQSLNEELQQFVLKGSELINKSQSYHCPLCDSDFKSFQELTNAISRNSALSDAMQNLVEQKIFTTNKRHY